MGENLSTGKKKEIKRAHIIEKWRIHTYRVKILLWLKKVSKGHINTGKLETKQLYG